MYKEQLVSFTFFLKKVNVLINNKIMWEKFFNKIKKSGEKKNVIESNKSASSVVKIEIGGYNFFLEDVFLVDPVDPNENDAKSALAEMINSPKLYIKSKDGKDAIGADFDFARNTFYEKFSEDKNPSESDVEKIRQALGQNKLSYTRAHQLLFIADQIDDQEIKSSIKNKYMALEDEYLPGENKSKDYAELDIDKKNKFMEALDNLAIEFYNKI